MTLRNLSYCKNDIIQYVDSGQYDKESYASLAALKTKIEALLGNDLLAVCFDIDDTAIRLENYWRSKDYAGTDETISESYLLVNEPAHLAVYDFYLYCLANNILVIFLSGRREKYRATTLELLANAGYKNFYKLDLKPTDSTLSDAKFKAQQIKNYTAEGLIVGAMIGDQATDHDNSALYQCSIPNFWYDVTAYEKTI